MHNTKPVILSYFDIKFWYYVISAILFFSILRGIRFPGIWSYSHFLFNYDLGFIKRGLIGEITSQFNSPFLLSYHFFFIYSLVIFAINIILLSGLIRDFINSQNPILIGCAIVFASSLAIVFLAHSIGYFDHLGLLIALTTFKINGFYRKMLFLLLSMPVALLVHEAILIMFFPVIFMSLLLSIEKEERRKKMILVGAFSGILLILGFIITNFTLEQPEVSAIYTRLQAKIAHPLRQDAFMVLLRDANDNFQIMKNLWFDKKRFIGLAQSLLVTAPTFLMFIYFTILILQKAKVKFYLIMLSVLASLSPLLLNLWGWDMHRWNTLSVTISFLMLHVVYSTSKNQSITSSRSIYAIFAFLIFLNGISSIPLFDGYHVKQFPFFEHQKYIIDLIQGHKTFPHIPLH